MLEIGPGPGYFSTHVAKKLKQGRLVLLDIQQQMLDMAKKRLVKRGILNIEYKLTDGLSFDFESNVFDRIFMVRLLERSKIKRTLKEGGILSIPELAGDPDKITIEEIQFLVCKYGFEVSHIFGNHLNYTANFKKKFHLINYSNGFGEIRR